MATALYSVWKTKDSHAAITKVDCVGDTSGGDLCTDPNGVGNCTYCKFYLSVVAVTKLP